MFSPSTNSRLIVSFVFLYARVTSIIWLQNCWTTSVSERTIMATVNIAIRWLQWNQQQVTRYSPFQMKVWSILTRLLYGRERCLHFRRLPATLHSCCSSPFRVSWRIARTQPGVHPRRLFGVIYKYFWRNRCLLAWARRHCSFDTRPYHIHKSVSSRSRRSSCCSIFAVLL